MTAYLGYRPGDDATPWGHFYDEAMRPLPPHVVDALALGPQAEPLLDDRDDLASFLDSDSRTENGYTVCGDGSIVVAVRTDLPRNTPAMWDWWFGWHGSDARRYKLWHPRAHVDARWADGEGERPDHSWVGRTSLVKEYLGATFAHAAIRFVPPAEFGLVVPDDQLTICARLGDAIRPVDVGWLVHHVRPTDGGAEMRSRFWLGGRHISVRGDRPAKALLDRVAAPVAGRLLGASAQSAAELLIHCSQEMSHLAAFLPDLHTDLGPA